VSKEKQSQQLSLYYDGDCPLCLREIRFLRKLTGDFVEYLDISSKNFDPKPLGKKQSELMAEIHARTADTSEWLIGMDAFRAVYEHTVFKHLSRLTALPVLKTMFDMAYKVFAKNRLKITGRSCKQCSVDGS